MIRLFVALSLPHELRVRLAGLRGQVPGARWVPPENMHITLRFIGEVDTATADDVHGELERIDTGPPEIRLSGVGQFESRGQVRALWAGVERNEELQRLQAKVEKACQRVGLAPETRRFHPHVTLARCKSTNLARVAHFIEDHSAFAAPAFQADSFVLYSSTLGRTGSVYSPEVEYPLGAFAFAEPY